MEENQSSTNPPVDPTSDDFMYKFNIHFIYRGPLTRCIEEENDLLTEDQRFVPNNNTIRVKICDSSSECNSPRCDRESNP